MKDVILDTDIGGDCDDAGALVILKSFVEQQAINLMCVTSCTTMEGAEHCIYSVFKDYHLEVPIGVNRGPAFMDTEKFNKYAFQVKKQCDDPAVTDAVSLLRKTLAGVATKVTVIAIGPQRNLYSLLKSGPDEISGLDGASLVEQKVEELVVMGGCFTKEAVFFRHKVEQIAEFNIAMDIAAAQYVSENWRTPIVYSPFELGHEIYTGRNLPAGQTAKYCYDLRHNYEKSIGDDSYPGLRESWDPIAACYGAVGCGELFSLSNFGKVSFDETGRSAFTVLKECPAFPHRILQGAAGSGEIEQALEALMC